MNIMHSIKRILMLFLWTNATLCLFAQVNDKSKKIAVFSKEINQNLESASKLKYTDWKKSEDYIHKAGKEAEKEGSEGVIAEFYRQAATIYYDRDIFDTSLQYNLYAYKYYKKNNPEKAAEIENQLAIINARLNNKDEAFAHFKNVYHYYFKKKNHYYTAKALNNIGTLYLNANKTDSALAYFKKGINEIRSYRDSTLNIYLNTNVARLYTKQKKWSVAQSYYTNAENLLKNTKDPSTYSWVYKEIANLYIESKQPEKAVQYAEKAKEFSRVRYSFNHRDVLQTLYKAYMIDKNYQRSAEYFQEYDRIRDSLNVEEKAVNIEKRKIESEFDDKQKIIELNNNKKLLTLIITILCLLVFTLALIFLLFRYKNNLVKVKLKNELADARENELKLALELKNKELVSKSVLETERVEMYQNLVQELKQIQENPEQSDIKKELNAIIFRLDKNASKSVWEEFELRFNNVYDSFYERLQTLHPNLNHNEKRLCALIKLNLSSKEISDITKISVKSVENSRTRLRKKLGLTNQKTELHQYLSDIS